MSSFGRVMITPTRYWSSAESAARNWGHAARIWMVARSIRDLCEGHCAPARHVCAAGLVTMAAKACERGW